MHYLTLMFNLAVSEVNLFLMRIVELACISYFMSDTRKKMSRTHLAFLMVAFAFIMILARSAALVLPYMNPGISVSIYTLMIIYYLIVFCFITLLHVIALKDGIYYLLIIFLCLHPLRLTLNYFTLILHGAEYPQGGELGFLSIAYLILYALISYTTFRLLKSRLDSTHTKTRWQIIWMLIACFPVFYITSMGFMPFFDQYERTLSTVLFAQLCGYSGLAMVVGFEYMLALRKKELELVKIETLLTNQHKLHQMKKETVDILNQKYHDLKNHLLYINLEGSKEIREDYVKKLEKEIESYETSLNTGNEAIDIIMAIKGLECLRRKIQVIPHLDGSKLNFLKPLCIATIFGNAMDNAVEALEQVEENKRELSIRLIEREQLLLLSFSNPYKNPLKWENGGLLTTKGNTHNHGYGIKCIESSINEYGGNVSINVNDGVFTLNILFGNKAV